MLSTIQQIKLRLFKTDESHRPPIVKYSFGATSAIITNLALIIGLNDSSNAKFNIIGSLLVIALADNFGDALGIHIYQESEGKNIKDVWIPTYTNFITRLLVSIGFIGIITLFPINIAVPMAIGYGLIILALISYVIAKIRKSNPIFTIIEHISIAIGIIFISKFLGKVIIGKFQKI